MTTPCSEQVTNPCNCTCDTGIVDIVMDINDNVNAKALALDAAVMSATNSAAEAEAAATYINNYVNTTTYVKTYQNEADGLADNVDGAKFVEINTTGDTSVTAATVNEIVSGVAVPISEVASKQYVDSLGNLRQTAVAIANVGFNKVWSPVLKVETDSQSKDAVLNSQAVSLFNRTELLKANVDRSILYFNDRTTATVVISVSKTSNNQVVEIKSDNSFGGATTRYTVLNGQLVNGKLAYSAKSIQYTPPGVGTAPITVEDKLKQTINVADFGADPTGLNDSTSAIQSAIDSISVGTVLFPAGVLRVSAKIIMKSGVSLRGNQTTITSTDPLAADSGFFESEVGSLLEFVEISGFTFKSDGVTDIHTPFDNPYGGGQSVGYKNRMIAVKVTGGGIGIRIDSCLFEGINIGADLQSVQQFTFTNNIGYLLGESLVKTNSCSTGKIAGNSTVYTLGGMTTAGDTNIANIPLAIVVNNNDSYNITVQDNVFFAIVGSGVLFTGYGTGNTAKDNKITLSGNSNTTTYGIYSLLSETTATGNYISGSGKSVSIYVTDGVVRDNTCVGSYDAVHIGRGDVSFNKLSSISLTHTTGAGVRTMLGFENVNIENNTIEGFTATGLVINNTKVLVSKNSFVNNGITHSSGLTNSLYNSGITIDSASHAGILIKDNKFVSDAEVGSTTRQSSGIVIKQLTQGVNPFDNYPHNITGNEFIFTGSIGTYPTNLNTYPCALTSYWDGVTDGTLVDNIGDGSNRSTKLKTTFTVASPAGFHNVVGVSATKPISVGRKGDIVESTDGVCMGWICTVNNTATWTEFGSLKSSAAFATSNASTTRTLNVTGVTTAQLGNVLATLIEDLRTAKVIS